MSEDPHAGETEGAEHALNNTSFAGAWRTDSLFILSSFLSPDEWKENVFCLMKERNQICVAIAEPPDGGR